MQKLILILILFSTIPSFFGQEIASKFAVGISYGLGNELKNTDYFYTNRYVKGQFYYSLKKTKNFEFQILLEPEINFATHQLLNLYFVTPDEPNFEERRERFTNPPRLSSFPVLPLVLDGGETSQDDFNFQAKVLEGIDLFKKRNPMKKFHEPKLTIYRSDYDKY